MHKKTSFLRVVSKITIFTCVFCTISAWAETTTCDVDFTPVTGNSWQNGTQTPTNPVEIESIGTKVGNKYSLSVTAQSKNLFNKKNWAGDGWYINTNGVITPFNQNATIPMRLTPGKVYYYKHCSVTGGFRVFYTTEENWTTGSSATWLVQSPVTSAANKVGSFTVPNDAKWVFIMAGRKESSSTTTTLQEQLDDYILSEDPITADTPYTPYSAPITTTVYLDEPLRKVGEYADVLDYKNGTITRNVGVKVLDGTEDWSSQTISLEQTFGPYISMSNWGAAQLSNRFPNYLYCSHFKNSASGVAATELNVIAPNSNFSNMLFAVDKRICGNDLTSWKAWLTAQYAAGTPVTVYYPLATPVVEQIENRSCPVPITDIQIATTKMVDDEFAQAEANLAATVQTIESVVSRTIAQTGQIQILQDTKQTRPDESCPANMKCLLVQDEDGTPHWYPIIEP